MYTLATENEYVALAQFLNRSPEVNINFTTLLITQGFQNDRVETWVRKSGGVIMGACAFYADIAYVFELDRPLYRELIDLLTQKKLRAITGPRYLAEAISQMIEHHRIWITHVMRLDVIDHVSEIDTHRVESLQLDDLSDKIAVQNKVFGLKTDVHDERQRTLLSNGILRSYVIKDDNKVVSTGEWTPSHPTFGLIVGIATLEDYRRHHYAEAISAKLCHEILSMGKTPVLRYDNAHAGALYKKIGFVEVADHAVIFIEEG